MSIPKRPDFRIIILQHQKIVRIPKHYRDKYWKETPNPIVLRLPNDFEQEISWVKSNNGEIYFQENWESFAKNLSHGYLLTFEYIGGPHFKVKIFGLNGSEINYSNIKSLNEKVVEAREKSKEIIEVSDEMPMQAQRTRNDKRKFNGGRKRGNMVKKAKKYPTNNDENPFFEVVMTKSYVEGNFMWIPKKFVKEHLNNYNGISNLRVGKDNPMKMNLKFNDKSEKSMMNGSWTHFSQNYNLQVDDSCKFVMTQRGPPSFNVTINRARSGSNPTNLQDSKGRNVIKHDTFEPNVNAGLYPYIPNAFLHRHKECCGKFMQLKVDGKLWSVQVKYYPGGSKLTTNWPKFKEEYKLEIGDHCRFKLIDEEKFVFEVSFVRNK